MNKRKRKRLESAGWKVAGAREFLDLSEEEADVVELKVRLAGAVREQRSRRGITQEQLGRMFHSSQSRIAKIEAADASVSIDLMIRCLLRLGASRRQVGAYISAPRRHAA